ncbi:hypothetical protein ON010_g17833 [Phytophthora cinnamomi]|nr:hypothetical protein ON010_g17833 [Phytophthora cinnamomi]
MYNTVDPTQRHLYVRPPHIGERLWNQAELDNPDPLNCAPVPILGFDDLLKRIKAQQEHAEKYNKYTDDLRAQLNEMDKHSRATEEKLEKCRHEHVQLFHAFGEGYAGHRTVAELWQAASARRDATCTLLDSPGQYKARLNDAVSLQRVQKETQPLPTSQLSPQDLQRLYERQQPACVFAKVTKLCVFVLKPAARGAALRSYFLHPSYLCMPNKEKEPTASGAGAADLVVRVHVAVRLDDQRGLVELVNGRGRRQAPLERLVHLRDHHLHVLGGLVVHGHAVNLAVRGEAGDGGADGGGGIHCRQGERERAHRERGEGRAHTGLEGAHGLADEAHGDEFGASGGFLDPKELFEDCSRLAVVATTPDTKT